MIEELLMKEHLKQKLYFHCCQTNKSFERATFYAYFSQFFFSLFCAFSECHTMLPYHNHNSIRYNRHLISDYLKTRIYSHSLPFSQSVSQSVVDLFRLFPIHIFPQSNTQMPSDRNQFCTLHQTRRRRQQPIFFILHWLCVCVCLHFVQHNWYENAFHIIRLD